MVLGKDVQRRGPSFSSISRFCFRLAQGYLNFQPFDYRFNNIIYALLCLVIVPKVCSEIPVSSFW